jgi:pimeloyl-ACP methyl ester carboxylesterase
MPADHVVVAPDGTRIASARHGSGPPIVLVHGAIGDRTSFRLVEPLLAAQFTVVTVDRRGHGASGDAAGTYAIEHEFADIAAVVDSLAEPAVVLGHSYGGSVALGAMLLTEHIGRLVLYEPSPGIRATDPAFVDRLEALIAWGARETVLELALTEFVDFGPDDLAAYRRTPLWASRVLAAHTIPREIRAEEAFRPDPAAFASITAPALLIVGGESPDWAWRGAEAVRAALPVSRTVVLEGEGHMATVTAPERLVEAVIGFAG